MGIEENKAAIRRFLSQEVFFGEGSLAVVDELFAPDVVWRSPGNGAVLSFGTGVIKSELEMYKKEEGEIAILEQIAEGESVATRYTLSYTYTADEPTLPGEHIDSSGVTFSRFANGKIRNYFVVARNVQLVEERKVAHN